MIFIKNSQRSFAVDTKSLEHDLQKLLDALGYPDFDVSLFLTTDATIRKYNRTYRHKDKATDILSFPYYPQATPGKRIKPASAEEKILGDIIISVAYANRAAQELEVSLPKHLQRLLVHGMCHLIGYDHETDAEFARMNKKEMALLATL